MTEPQIRVRLCPGGPMLVTGATSVVSEDGTEVPTRRRTVAVCRCGASGIRPWCDGSHKMLDRERRDAPARPRAV